MYISDKRFADTHTYRNTSRDNIIPLLWWKYDSLSFCSARSREKDVRQYEIRSAFFVENWQLILDTFVFCKKKKEKKSKRRENSLGLFSSMAAGLKLYNGRIVCNTMRNVTFEISTARLLPILRIEILLLSKYLTNISCYWQYRIDNIIFPLARWIIIKIMSNIHVELL